MKSQRGIGQNPRAVKLRYLDRSAEEAGRQKRQRSIPHRLTPTSGINYITVDDVDETEFDDFGINYPNRYIKCFAERAQLDKLAAVHGLLKAYEGKTFDEYYSAFKTGCSQSGVAAIHVAQHAMEKLYQKSEVIDGVIYGINKRMFGPQKYRLKTGEYYLEEGIIKKVLGPNTPPPKVYPKRKGFWAEVSVNAKNADPDFPNKKEIQYRYIIGPFNSNKIPRALLNSFELEAGFSNNIYFIPPTKGIHSQLPVPGHYRVDSYRDTKWFPQYYIVLDVAKTRTNPYSLNRRNNRPTSCSVGTVVFDSDIVSPKP